MVVAPVIAGPLLGFGHPLITGPLAMLALLTVAVVAARGRTRVGVTAGTLDPPGALARPPA